jgi:hypothetical protein
MELGQYGWNRKVDIFQQRTVFLESPVPATSNYGLLNLGDAPFDGMSPGSFSDNPFSTVIAINIKAQSGVRFFSCQAAGTQYFSMNADGTTFVLKNSDTVTGNGVVNIGSGFYTGAGQFAGSVNGTYLAINSLSGFTGRFIDCHVSGSSVFSVDNFGLVQSGSLWTLQAPNSTTQFSTINIGPSFFTGAGQFAGSASGTALGICYATGYAGNFADWQVNGVSKFKVSASGDVTANTVSPAKLTGLAAVEAALEFV